MVKEEVYSPVEDKNIREHLEDSIMWQKAFKRDEITDVMLHSTDWWVYTIKFDGTTPTQLLNIKKI